MPEPKQLGQQSNSSSVVVATEQHYTIAEIAEMWQLSRDAVTRLFENEAGVLILGDTNPRRRKRRYLTLRIPQSVLERVHSRWSLVSY